MKHLRLSLLAASLSTILFTPVSHAAAFQFYELGTPIVGSAGVGQAAVASDASTSYFNPAGMTNSSSSQFMLGTQAVLPYINFSPNSSTTILGTNGGSAGQVTPGLGVFYLYDYSSKVKLGVSVTTPYGGMLNYNDHWVGRYVVQQLTFYTFNLNPTIAYKINDWVSVGGGVAVEYAYLNQTLALPVSPTFDGQATVKLDNVSPGFNLGVFVEPTCATKIGVAYRSQIIHNFRGNVEFLNTGILPSASSKMVMPSNVIASIAQQMTSKFTLLGELGWANWSSMVNSIVTVHGFSAVTPLNWHDTYRLGLGAQYQAMPSLLLKAGASFDSSPTSASLRLPVLPMDRQIRVAAGIEYALVKAVTLGLSYEYMNLGVASINNTSSNGVFAGSYNRNFANTVQASLNVAC